MFQIQIYLLIHNHINNEIINSSYRYEFLKQDTKNRGE